MRPATAAREMTVVFVESMMKYRRLDVLKRSIGYWVVELDNEAVIVVGIELFEADEDSPLYLGKGYGDASTSMNFVRKILNLYSPIGVSTAMILRRHDPSSTASEEELLPAVALHI